MTCHFNNFTLYGSKQLCSKCIWFISNKNFLQETADLVTFTAEILNGRLHFCAVQNLNNRKVRQKSIILAKFCQTICKFYVMHIASLFVFIKSLNGPSYAFFLWILKTGFHFSRKKRFSVISVSCFQWKCEINFPLKRQQRHYAQLNRSTRKRCEICSK